MPPRVRPQAKTNVVMPGGASLMKPPRGAKARRASAPSMASSPFRPAAAPPMAPPPAPKKVLSKTAQRREKKRANSMPLPGAGYPTTPAMQQPMINAARSAFQPINSMARSPLQPKNPSTSMPGLKRSMSTSSASAGPPGVGQSATLSMLSKRGGMYTQPSIAGQARGFSTMQQPQQPTMAPPPEAMGSARSLGKLKRAKSMDVGASAREQSMGAFQPATGQVFGGAGMAGQGPGNGKALRRRQSMGNMINAPGSGGLGGMAQQQPVYPPGMFNAAPPAPFGRSSGRHGLRGPPPYALGGQQLQQQSPFAAQNPQQPYPPPSQGYPQEYPMQQDMMAQDRDAGGMAATPEEAGEYGDYDGGAPAVGGGGKRRAAAAAAMDTMVTVAQTAKKTGSKAFKRVLEQAMEGMQISQNPAGWKGLNEQNARVQLAYIGTDGQKHEQTLEFPSGLGLLDALRNATAGGMPDKNAVAAVLGKMGTFAWNHRDMVAPAILTAASVVGGPKGWALNLVLSQMLKK